MCSLIPRLAVRTRLVLVIHKLEARKPTNTGQLAAECLEGSRVVLRGGQEAAKDPGPLVAPGTRPLLLFPHEDATDLREHVGGDPITLIVPDGTWRQASKVRRRVAGLEGVPCARLPPGAPSRYLLRSESHDDGLATHEAVARALGILEGPEVEEAMMRVFRAMVDRALWSRGDLRTFEVSLGIPPGVVRHDPTSGMIPLPSAKPSW